MNNASAPLSPTTGYSGTGAGIVSGTATGNVAQSLGDSGGALNNPLGAQPVLGSTPGVGSPGGGGGAAGDTDAGGAKYLGGINRSQSPSNPATSNVPTHSGIGSGGILGLTHLNCMNQFELVSSYSPGTAPPLPNQLGVPSSGPGGTPQLTAPGVATPSGAPPDQGGSCPA